MTVKIRSAGRLIDASGKYVETSVVVHGSDGYDTTLLVTSLAQILLDPDCRTITGYVLDENRC